MAYSSADDVTGIDVGKSIDFGITASRKWFEKRGNHSEAHLNETEVAAIFALGFQIGYEHAAATALRTISAVQELVK